LRQPRYWGDGLFGKTSAGRRPPATRCGSKGEGLACPVRRWPGQCLAAGAL